VAVNKSIIEDKLDNALNSFGQGIPRLAEMTDLVNEEKVKLQLHEALANVLDFAQEATLYYKQSCLSKLCFKSIEVLIDPGL
jgi:hypothetical protein